jgi:5,6-dimethylbenzimidazole synthase
LERYAFPPCEKKGVYNAIYKRRDIRAQFKPDPIPEDVLRRILDAAHHAPSVGFMQPWNFIIIRDKETKRRVKESFNREKIASSYLVDELRKSKYLSFKLEGIMEAPINLCVTCDRTRFGPFVIGRTSILETDLYSVCCAIQNLWLAARAEGIGVGWVSILSNDDLRSILEIPSHVLPVAYLCLGYVTYFPEKPDLERLDWLKRLPLEEVVFFEKWGQKEPRPFKK